MIAFRRVVAISIVFGLWGGEALAEVLLDRQVGGFREIEALLAPHDLTEAFASKYASAVASRSDLNKVTLFSAKGDASQYTVQYGCRTPEGCEHAIARKSPLVSFAAEVWQCEAGTSIYFSNPNGNVRQIDSPCTTLKIGDATYLIRRAYAIPEVPLFRDRPGRGAFIGVHIRGPELLNEDKCVTVTKAVQRLFRHDNVRVNIRGDDYLFIHGSEYPLYNPFHPVPQSGLYEAFKHPSFLCNIDSKARVTCMRFPQE